MSDDWIVVIPTDPRWVPDDAQESAARTVMAELAPDRHGLAAERHGRIMFEHCGGNVEAVACPACGADLLGTGWWSEALDRAWDGDGFEALEVATPCCATATTLNDLAYRWPQGFASWSLSVMNARRGPIDEVERERLESALGHPVRIVYRHI